LTNNGQDGKLETNASRKAAGPHLKTGIRIGAFDRSADSIIPNIDYPVPANESSIKKSDILDQRIKEEPVDQKCDQRNEDEAQIQPNKKLIGCISKASGRA
jgi:ribosomal protein S2